MSERSIYIDFNNRHVFLNGLIDNNEKENASDFFWYRNNELFCINDIRRRFVRNKKTKLTVQKLLDMGFLQFPRKSDAYIFGLMIKYLDCENFSPFLSCDNEIEKMDILYEFSLKYDFYKEFSLLMDYIEYNIINDWCKINDIILKSNFDLDAIDVEQICNKIKCKLIQI